VGGDRVPGIVNPREQKDQHRGGDNEQCLADAAVPGGRPGIAYYRLPGSPRKYWSVYEVKPVAQWAQALRGLRCGTLAWWVFDNTAGGGAAGNALPMLERLGAGRGRRVPSGRLQE
jgi:uncharacterized protein YecE (DUF72 family)